MPPVSVTIHAEKLLAFAEEPALGEVLVSSFGFSPHAATSSARPATPAASRIPLDTLPPC
ncbi:hypothetical protein GCM10010468_69540 [Actinocorallia longicatena]|uniref:Uncharacterized protein n=1 Tax=Actinocorallia longicatena TaxID=111803 RepID=A0ABP6QML9_9ACTN